MLRVVQRVNGAILWANMHLLLWLSLVPFTMRWMGENNFTTAPVALYGIVLRRAGAAYSMLAITLIRF